jgi:hypothetical protein
MTALTSYGAAPAIPTTGILGVVASREQPTGDGVAHFLLGESLVHPLVLLCICPVVARSWSCTHSSTISMLQSWLRRRVDGACSWPGGNAPNMPIMTCHMTHAQSNKAMLPLVPLVPYTAHSR